MALLAAAALGAAVGAAPAEGAFPGQNGKLAFVRAGNIWTVNADGTGPTQLTTEGSSIGPRWSPDGGQIASTAKRANAEPLACSSCELDIWVMDADGSNRRQVTDSPGFDWVHGPSWSPDGTRLSFIRGLHIWTVKLDGTDQQRVTPDTDPDCFNDYSSAVWSPDGTAFGTNGDEVCEHERTFNAVVDLSGNITHFRYSNDFQFLDDWSPDSHWLLIGTSGPDAGVGTFALVPAYEPCTSPNRTHGPPLAFGSCAPPVRTPGELTVGTPESNGKGPHSTSEVHLRVVPGIPSTPADEADVHLYGTVNDVRVASDLSDYTGTLEARVTLRITDKDNTPHPGGPGAATMQDVPWSFPIPCAATASATIGAECSFDTTAEAFVPGIANEGRRAIWALGQLAIHDGAGNVFMRQGVFVP